MGGYYNGQAVGVPYLNGAKHNMIRGRDCFFPPFYKVGDYWTRWAGKPNNSVSLLMLKWDTAEIYNWHYECARDGWEPRSLTYRFADELHDGRTIVPIENYVHNPAPIDGGEPFIRGSEGIQFEYSTGSLLVTNTDSGHEGWVTTEVTLPPGDYELRVNVVSINSTYGTPQGPIISIAAGDTTLNTAPYAGNNLIHHCSFTLPRRRKIQLRLHANVPTGAPSAASRFNHIMCMNTEAWAQLDMLGLVWFDANTVSDPIYQEE
ncbi:hypothetical protein LF907_04640 [Bifidobacterium pseudolongum]|uniref:hypothetical protein n=1 Tax=Bifidobacterium pseudolongum TaxID=1694 RepID=UPI001F114E05|nr:hypothetical protein [Bifidobacterium pseudolongum]MCH4849897.1 hypothetical protein [Bifidobacterium pseudolongum]